MTRLVVSIQANGIEQFANSLSKKTGARELLGQWADTYFAFIHARHQSRGAGTWPPTKLATIKQRRSKNRGNRSTSQATLMDTLQLLGISAKNGRGQERRLDVSTMAVRVGADRQTVYRDPRKGRLGRHTRTLSRLLILHAAGQPVGSNRRVVFVPPSESIKNQMSQQAAEWVKKIK